MGGVDGVVIGATASALAGNGVAMNVAAPLASKATGGMDVGAFDSLEEFVVGGEVITSVGTRF